MTSKLEALERLANLRDRGVLSEDEFAAEKSILLGTGSLGALESTPVVEAQKLIPPVSADQPKPKLTYAERREASRAFEQKVWNFGPITSVEDARLLLSGGWFSFWLITADGLIDVGRNCWTALSGGVVDPAVTNGNALVASVVGFSIFTIITLVTALMAVKRRSSIAAGFLIILALLELWLAVSVRWNDFRTLAHAAFLLCVPGMLLAFQCLRANVVLRKMSEAQGSGVA